MKINECMCKDVCFIKPDCKVFDAARIMCENHIGCIPICDDERQVVGLLTDRDILLRSVACNKDTKNTPVSEIMTCNISTCGCDDEISQAQNTMANKQVRRIPVVENSKLVGIITMGDLVNNQNVSNQEVSQTVSHICHCGQDAKNNW